MDFKIEPVDHDEIFEKLLGQLDQTRIATQEIIDFMRVPPWLMRDLSESKSNFSKKDKKEIREIYKHGL